MMIRPRFVVLIAVATFIVGGAAACTVSQLVIQKDMISQANERTALTDKVARLKAKLSNQPAPGGQVAGQLGKLSVPAQPEDDQIRSTVAGLQAAVAQYQQQLAATQKELADSQTTAQQYINALNSANAQVSELTNALAANGQGGLILNNQLGVVPYVVVPSPYGRHEEHREYYRRR